MKVEQKVKQYLDKIKKEDKKINSFLQINENVIEEAREVDRKKKKGRLYGYVFGIKANINVKGLNASCASKTLENYKCGFDATVIEKIRAEDGVIIGMLNMDEFACGSSGESSAFGPCQNPAAMGKIPGGSSSGAGAAVAAGFCDVALGSDTGGSIRSPASHCGVIGIKPSYGLVSRYGLIDLSMSLDQIGPVAKNIEDAALVLDVIKGKDERDTKTFESDKIKLSKPKKIRVGVLRVDGIDKRIQTLVDEKIDLLKEKYGWDVKEVEVNHMDLAVQTYYPLVYVEFFSGTRRFDGRKYGLRIDDNSGDEVMRRILGGKEITKAEYEGAHYKKALVVKELIKEEFESVLKEVDCLIFPVSPILPWNIGECNEMSTEEIYASDALTCPVNLAELCSVSLPAGKVEDIPVGMQVVCSKGNESKMLSIAREVEGL